MRTARIIGLATAALLAGTPVSAAEPPARIGVMPVTFEGEVSPEDQAALEQALLGALTDDTVQAEPISTRCADAPCVAEQAATLGVRRVVEATVKFDTNDYHVTLAVLDGAGAPVRSLEFSCEICTVPDMEARFTKAAEDLREQLLVTTSLVKVDSRPPGAAVFVDGRREGVTPLEVEVPAGSHQIRVEHPGHEPQARTIEAEAGAPTAVSVTLTPVAEDTAPPPRRQGLWIAGLGLVGAGAAATIGGAVLLVLDSRPIQRKCEGNNVDVNGQCRFLHDTLTGGAVAAAVGGAALVTGITLAVLGRKGRRAGATEQQARRIRVEPSVTGVRVSF